MILFFFYLQLPAESGQLSAESGQLSAQSEQLPAESGQLPVESAQFTEDISHGRKKKLSIAGQLLFEDTVNKRWTVFPKIKRKIDDEIQYFVEYINKKKIAIIVKENLTKLVKMYKEKSCEFVNFLERVDTEESRKEKLSHELIVSALELRLENTILSYIKHI